MKIKKKDFEEIIDLSEFLEYFLNLIENGALIDSVTNSEINDLRYLSESRIREEILLNSQYSYFKRYVKINEKFKQNYLLLAKVSLKFQQVDQSSIRFK